MVEDVGGVLEAARAAHDGHAFPDAAEALSGRGDLVEIEVDVVGDGDVELAVAIVVDEGAAGAPLLAGAGDPGFAGYLAKRAVALVVEEAVEAVSGDVDVVVSIVVVVADAGALSPAGGGEAGFGGDVGECAIVIVTK